MKTIAVAVILLLIAIYYAQAIVAQVFVDDYIRPRSLFVALLIGTVVTGVSALAINVEVPD